MSVANVRIHTFIPVNVNMETTFHEVSKLIFGCVAQGLIGGKLILNIILDAEMSLCIY
jgi:hypothetical protein